MRAGTSEQRHEVRWWQIRCLLQIWRKTWETRASSFRRSVSLFFSYDINDLGNNIKRKDGWHCGILNDELNINRARLSNVRHGHVLLPNMVCNRATTERWVLWVLLYHFNHFVRPLSPAVWMWMKSEVCPLSRPKWSTKKNFGLRQEPQAYVWCGIRPDYSRIWAVVPSPATDGRKFFFVQPVPCPPLGRTDWNGTVAPNYLVLLSSSALA